MVEILHPMSLYSLKPGSIRKPLPGASRHIVPGAASCESTCAARVHLVLNPVNYRVAGTLVSDS